MVVTKLERRMRIPKSRIPVALIQAVVLQRKPMERLQQRKMMDKRRIQTTQRRMVAASRKVVGLQQRQIRALRWEARKRKVIITRIALPLMARTGIVSCSMEQIHNNNIISIFILLR
jgi:hypothetical protein